MKNMPPDIQIEINNTCNSKCRTCSLKYMKRKREIMKFNLFKKIVNELKKNDYSGRISPFYMGEPLLVKNILDFLRYIKQNVPKASVRLFTNASLLTSEKSEAIVKEQLIDNLVISFDGGTKKSYESIRIGLNFDSVRNNVHDFIKIRNKHKKKTPRVEISMVVTKSNKDTTDRLKDEFKDADDVTFHRYFEAATPGTEKWIYNKPKKRSRIKDFWSKRNFCFALDCMTILTSGIVAQCCVDYEGFAPLGDLRKDTIEQIWNGKKLKTIKHNIKHRRFDKLNLCANCDEIEQNPISRQITKNYKKLSKHPRILKIMQLVYAKIGAKGIANATVKDNENSSS